MRRGGEGIVEEERGERGGGGGETSGKRGKTLETGQVHCKKNNK